MEPTDSVLNGKQGSNGDYKCGITRWFEEMAEKAGLVQTETLRRILELNHGTEYLRNWLGDVNVQELDSTSLESIYASSVPLASHADLEPYIQRIADGDSSPILTSQPITSLSLSSGTTEGRQKLLPFTRHSSQTTLQIFSLAAAYRSRAYPIRPGGRILEFIYGSKGFKTKGGLKVATATSHYFASEDFKIKQKKTKSFACSPEEVISGGDYKQSTYCHLLLGLVFSDEVEFIASTFAYSIVQAFTSFEELWEDLCEDIREGTLNTKRVTLPKMRKAVLEMLSPNSNLSSRIKEKCRNLDALNWASLIPNLWPNAKYVYSISTGSMEPYMKKLKHYAGDLPIVCADYGSTESWIGVNIDPSYPPEKVTFAVVPSFSYFEFIPLYRTKQQCNGCGAVDDFAEGEPVPLSQVKIGQEYELVLTTYTGLYRYRLGDVVEVAGFFKSTPKLNFICRRKLILTVNIDKNTEKDLQLVVERASQIVLTKKSKAELVDFTSHANVTQQPGHYVIYWEIKGEVEDTVLGDCCTEMDASFVDSGYVVSRKMNSIGALELCIVEKGTFKKILDHYVRNGAALSQFKTPRCTTNQMLLTILNLSTIKRFTSSAYGG